MGGSLGDHLYLRQLGPWVVVWVWVASRYGCVLWVCYGAVGGIKVGETVE